MPDPTKWFLDIVEYEDGESASNAFSAGPIVFEDNEVITLLEFQTRINNAFDAATDNGLTLHEYVLKMANIDSPVEILGEAAADNLPASLIELGIEYHIYARDMMGPLGPTTSGPLDEDFRFKILFWSGPHGASEVGRPTIGPFDSFDEVLPQTRVDYVAEADVHLVTTPAFSKRAVMISRPPVAPDIEFIPIIGSFSTVKIFFNGMVGEYDDSPIIMTQSDLKNFAKQYIAQGITNFTSVDEIQNALEADAAALGPINFRSDDPVKSFQIFRTATYPVSYADFGAPRTFTQTIAYGKHAAGGLYTDTLASNIPYYYCFRSVDTHGNVSNPSHVYRIELVDNDGQRFLTQKVVYFESPTEKYLQPKKTGRKLIYIEPSESNLQFDSETYIDDPTTGAINPYATPNDNILGKQQVDNCWGEIFKIRVTSRKTGKKFDINVTFKNTGVQNP